MIIDYLEIQNKIQKILNEGKLNKDDEKVKELRKSFTREINSFSKKLKKNMRIF